MSFNMYMPTRVLFGTGGCRYKTSVFIYTRERKDLPENHKYVRKMRIISKQYLRPNRHKHFML
jgi:hypothetical protein